MSTKLTQEDVKEIFEILNASSFDEVRIETPDLKIHIRKNANGHEPDYSFAADNRNTPIAPASPMVVPLSAATTPMASADCLEVRAPMLGTFYQRPKPGADPFVQVGTKVEPDTVIGIIEVMKLMNSMTAGVSGEVVEFVVSDGQLVEYDQIIMRVRKLS